MLSFGSDIPQAETLKTVPFSLSNAHAVSEFHPRYTLYSYLSINIVRIDYHSILDHPLNRHVVIVSMKR